MLEFGIGFLVGCTTLVSLLFVVEKVDRRRKKAVEGMKYHLPTYSEFFMEK